MSHEQAATPSRGKFLSASETIGDLDSPFYDDERQRDVWNEASAVGFQVMLWLTIAAAAVMVWAGGASALPYAVPVFAIGGAGSTVALVYARAHHVDVGTASRANRARLTLVLVLLAAFVAGVVRALPDSGFGGGLRIGVGFGALCAVAGGVAGVWTARQRAQQAEELGDDG